MTSIYLTTGQLVTVGPDGKPYDTPDAAEASVADRNQRAKELGIKARYTTGPSAKAGVTRGLPKAES
jgi:hypothetical protein